MEQFARRVLAPGAGSRARECFRGWRRAHTAVATCTCSQAGACARRMRSGAAQQPRARTQHAVIMEELEHISANFYAGVQAKSDCPRYARTRPAGEALGRAPRGRASAGALVPRRAAGRSCFLSAFAELPLALPQCSQSSPPPPPPRPGRLHGARRRATSSCAGSSPHPHVQVCRSWWGPGRRRRRRRFLVDGRVAASRPASSRVLVGS